MADQTKSSKAYVIGIDSGTSSTRAILFDEKGRALAEGRRAYDVLRPQPGWVEQKAVWWWEALAGSIRDLLSKSPVKSEQIQGLAITSQTSVKNFMTKHDSIRTAMIDYQIGAKVVEDSQKVSGGKAQVTVEIPLRPLWTMILFYQKKLSIKIR